MKTLWVCSTCGATTGKNLSGPSGGGGGPRCAACGGSMKKIKATPTPETTP